MDTELNYTDVPWTIEGVPEARHTGSGDDNALHIMQLDPHNEGCGVFVASIPGGAIHGYAQRNATLIAASPVMLTALYEVQKALAAYRDGKEYRHPTLGQLSMEEVKYTIVDPAIELAERTWKP